MKQVSSGKFLLRMEPVLHAALARRAAGERLSLNQLCVELLDRGLRTKPETPWWHGIGERLLPKLERRFGRALLGVLAFGSQVQGTAATDSDLDLLIVLDDATPLRRELYRWWDDEVRIDAPAPVNPQFVHLPENAENAGGIWLEAALSHDVLREEGTVVSSALATIRNAIAAGRIRRHWINGQPYWIRREDEKS